MWLLAAIQPLGTADLAGIRRSP